MITFRELQDEDVAAPTERLVDDTDGAARITVAPSQWWELVRSDPRRHGWIIQRHSEAIGYLDAECAADQGTAPSAGHERCVVYLALLLFPVARGRGLAREVVLRALSLPELVVASELIAYVEPDNQPARRTLLSAGFVENGTDSDGLVEHRRCPAVSRQS